MDHGAAMGHGSHGGSRGEGTILIAEARVQTERASRYLVQLCRHVSKVGRAHSQMQARVEWSDDRGMISFDWGRCSLRALPGVLRLRAEAPDEDALRRIEHRVADRLEQIGRRDRLTVTWAPPQSAGEESTENSPTRQGDTREPHIDVMAEDADHHATGRTRA
jgi:hypothetical protein